MVSEGRRRPCPGRRVFCNTAGITSPPATRVIQPATGPGHARSRKDAQVIDRLPRALLAACAMMLALSVGAQNVAPGDPYAERIQHCLQLAQQAPRDALPLADSLLAITALPDRPRLGAALCRAHALRNMGQGAEALAAITQAQELLEAPGVPEQQRFGALMNLAGMLQSLGRTSEALPLLERALDMAGEDGSPQEQFAALHGIALARSVGLNDPEGAEPYFQRALTLVERHPMPASMAELMLHYNHGYTLLLVGRHDEADASFARALAVATRLPDQDQLRHRVISHRGEILLARGDTTAARARFEEALAWQREHHDAQAESVTEARLARLYLVRDEPRQALAHAERALAVAEEGGYAAETGAALDQLIAVHAALGNTDQVGEYARRALAFERDAARGVDLERLAALQARADAAATVPTSSPRTRVARDTAIVALVLLLLAGAVVLLRSRRRQRQLTELSATDPLTGLCNRRDGTRRIEALPPPSANGEDTRHALLLVDLDRFKAINDAHGHAAGDRVLTQAAERLRQACDGEDIIARWGGEEFLVVRPDTSREAAFAFADHLRKAIEHDAFDIGEEKMLAVTASVGLAPTPFFPETDGRWTDAIGMADRALYVAKHAGRNAWAGIWGLAGGGHVDLHRVRENPEQALAEGWVVIGGNRPMSWLPVRGPQPVRHSGQTDDAGQDRKAGRSA